MRLDDYKPLFIVVDGGDGSGKDTQCKMIARYLKSKGVKSIRIRSHPATDNKFGLHAKKALEMGGRIGHLHAALFYTIDVIRSLIYYYRHKNEVLIFSRYLLGVCYLPSSLVLFGYDFFSFLLPKSDFLFYLKVTPENARNRIQTRGEMEEMFEQLPKLQKMYKKMNYVTKLKEWRVIDGNMNYVTKLKEWRVIDGNTTPMKVWAQIKHELSSISY
ncbi:MAG: thymidylate kinase [Candidatus Hodarchaeales archaeon]